METFSISPPIILVGEGNWLLGVISFGTTKSVFNLTNENNSCSISILGFWITRGGQQTIIKLRELKEL